jgi:prolipoprotein diacylglyceryltransferase
VALTAGAGALLGGRIGYVLLLWHIYAGEWGRILDIRAGGLDWHGALIGGLIGLALGWRLRARGHIPWARLTDRAAFALPALLLIGWIGCAHAGCAPGAEVRTLADHPAWAVTWARDVYGIYAPRYNTPLYGAGLAGLTLLVMLRARQGRLWAGAAVIGAGMCVIGFWRGDPAPLAFGVRADQIASALIAAWGGVLWYMAGRSAARQTAPQPDQGAPT